MESARPYTPGFSGPSDPARPARPARAAGLSRAARGVRPRAPRGLLAASRAAAVSFVPRPSAGGVIDAEQRLVQRLTMGWSPAEQALVEEIGYKAYLERQLDYESIDDSELESLLAQALPSLALSPAEILARYGGNNRGRPVVELIVARIYRALYSPRQLFERMVEFWTDHFNIDLFADSGPVLKPTDDREVIRVHALGTFPELLRASARSPAMLSYLTNDSNRKGHPNENYARELMELHTMGADNGYTQKDVREVARCFTGWTIQGERAGPEAGRFVFNPATHDDGKKVVLGRTIPAGGGVEDGERVLEILAGRKETSRFIAEKLLRWFWRYEPKKSAINKVAAVYRKTGGDIREMLRVVLRRNRIRRARPKLKRPLHLTVSTLRALAAELDSPAYLIEQLLLTGHLPYAWSPPNGYPDSEGYWSGFILARWNFATTFLDPGRRTGIEVDLPFLDAGLEAAELVREIDRALLNGSMGDATRQSLEDFLGSGDLDRKRILDAVGLAVASPEFQEY